ncbi:MAG: 16S rRNA (uracil(1498)-N(3))-methyltransferase [Herpetosiphon sp.]
MRWFIAAPTVDGNASARYPWAMAKKQSRLPQSGVRQRPTDDRNTYRFFINPDTIKSDVVSIDDPETVHQLVAVLRLARGQHITILDNTGQSYVVELHHVDNHIVMGMIITSTQPATEPRLNITLHVALLRSERFELVLQKGTELGIRTFIPVVTERSFIRDVDIVSTKRDRWMRIIREAAEQSGRAILPDLKTAMQLDEAFHVVSHAGSAILLWEGRGAKSLRLMNVQASSYISLFSGPEGGWTDKERTSAEEQGIQLATLGPRIFRAETAPIIASAALLFQAGDLD